MDILELQRWFRDHVSINGERYELDDEQAAIVLDEHKHTLVTARAGSGKTYTLIAKIVYLIAIKKVDPSHIMALGFYHDPQTDFEKRLKSVRVDNNPLPSGSQISRTFHSLAFQVVGRHNSILMNDKEQKTDNQAIYIDAIVKRIVDSRKIYDFIREDSYEPKRENYKTEEDYKLALKYTRYDTLNGETVKSRGEKIIADYLFEHDIDYKYEEISFYPTKLAKYATDDEAEERLKSRDKITPDFYLTDSKTLWEHWAINGEETEEEQKQINESGVIDSYQDYYDNMEFKKWFYSKEWLDESKITTEDAKKDEYLQKFLTYNKFISTNYTKAESREEFESKLTSLLKEHELYKNILQEAALLEKFKRIPENISQSTKRVSQFIQRAEQQFPGNMEALQQKCKEEPEKHTRLFYDVALSAYEYYLNDLTADPNESERGLIQELFPGKVYTTDHSLNLNTATELIRNHSESPNCPFNLDELEYILLDEYQDFSLLFLNLIQAITERNSDIRILAVGDDWQAISSFAGSSLEYFYNFEKYFPEDTTRLSITTNRRSVESIVDIANQFMLKAFNDSKGAVSIHKDKDDQVLNNCTLSNIHNFTKTHDGDYSNGYKKYGVLLSEIVRDNSGKTIRFLSRTNELKLENNETRNLAKYQNEFIAKYHDKIKGANLDDDICFATVNSSKGLQADVVVILEADTGRFPIFHPDNHLFKVFGETEQAALDEQKRLFYVALTRAKDRIYIIHKNDFTPTEQKDRNFLSMLDMEKFKKYLKESFLSLETRIRQGQTIIFNAVKVVLKPNRFKPDQIDIIATASNGDKVTQYSAFENGASVKQLKRYASLCSLERPMKIKGKPSKKYGDKVYINMYDPDIAYGVSYY